MDNEKMRIISAVLMLFTALIELLKCILWGQFPIHLLIIQKNIKFDRINS